MLEITPPPLARQIGGIAADLRAQAQQEAAHTGLAAVVHALILALLARIFGRLENMVALWQADQLPAPMPQSARATPTRPAAPAPPANPWRWLAAFLPFPAIQAAEPRHATHPRTPRPRQAPRPAPRQATAPAAKRAAPIAAVRPSRARSGPFNPSATVLQAHTTAPARPGVSKPTPATAPSHALIVPFT